MTILYSSLQLGLLYGIMVMGIYISFRILDIPDLTTEGSFAFGVAVSAVLAKAGHPYLGLVLSVVAGVAAGCTTGILQTKLKIHPILAGIITMSGLYSINLAVMNESPNITLLNARTIFSDVRKLMPGVDKEIVKLIIIALFALVVFMLLALFFKTHFGLCIRATGDNQDMLRASSVDVDGTKIAALGIGNACIALSGGLTAQFQSFGDINASVGILVVGLASVIIGEAIFGRRSVTIGFVSAVVGSIIYRAIIVAATKYNFFPAYMFKLLSAVIVIIALALPVIKEGIKKHGIRKGGRRNA